jgi:hypothetical protein
MVAATAHADSVATMGGIIGDVKINQGREFMQALPGQAVSAGDRIMAMEGSSTSITFSDGCVLQISGGSLITVPATSTCKGGQVRSQQIAPANSDAVGNVAANGGAEAGAVNGVSQSTLEWGYVGTAVIVACIMFCGNDDENNNNTVSP